MSTKFFKPIEPNFLFAKVAIHGWKGSGKSVTAVLLAYAIAKEFGIDPNSIAYLDTEGRAIDIQEAFCEPLGFRMQHGLTRDFAQVCTAIREAEKECPILIIDSITHIYRSFVEAFLKTKRRDHLFIQDHAILQAVWQERFVDTFMNSQAHIIACGRSSNVFEDQEDPDDPSRTKLVTVGTKMAVEKEFGYEPGLVFEMQKDFQSNGKTARFQRKIIIAKDSTSLLEGKTFLLRRCNPAANSAQQAKFYAEQVAGIFSPLLKKIAARRSQTNGKHQAFPTNKEQTESLWRKQASGQHRTADPRAVALEVIEAQLHLAFGEARGNGLKALKIHTLEEIFRTSSWSAVQNLPLAELEAGARIAQALARAMDGVDLQHLDKRGLSGIISKATDQAFQHDIS